MRIIKWIHLCVSFFFHHYWRCVLRASIISRFLYFHPNSLVSLCWKNNQWKEAKRSDHLATFWRKLASSAYSSYTLNGLVSLTEERKQSSSKQDALRKASNKKAHKQDTITYVLPGDVTISGFVFSCKVFGILQLEKDFIMKEQTRSNHLPRTSIIGWFLYLY